MRIEELIRFEEGTPGHPLDIPNGMTLGRQPETRLPESIGLPDNITDWPEDWRFLYEERAAIMEYDGNLPRERAETLAEADVRKEFEDYAKDAAEGLLRGAASPL